MIETSEVSVAALVKGGNDCRTNKTTNAKKTNKKSVANNKCLLPAAKKQKHEKNVNSTKSNSSKIAEEASLIKSMVSIPDSVQLKIFDYLLDIMRCIGAFDGTNHKRSIVQAIRENENHRKFFLNNGNMLNYDLEAYPPAYIAGYCEYDDGFKELPDKLRYAANLVHGMNLDMAYLHMSRPIP